MADTIVALSSGRPPAAIAVVRLSGPAALTVAASLAGALPPPRRAGLRALRDPQGSLLDRALTVVFPGPASATGEDVVEFHCHGGRAVTAAVEAALLTHQGVRRAEPGEFTRRALLHGRIDLAEAEGLADLLEAETEGQRIAALASAEGRLSQCVGGWVERLSGIAGQVEALLDYGDEVGDGPAHGDLIGDLAEVADDMAAVLAIPPVERLKDGVHVVLAGPPNSGKSTLLNRLAGRDAAIVSPVSGTTRDRIEAPVVHEGVAYLLIDTAGLTRTDDAVEAIGVERAAAAIAAADILLWLGDTEPPRTDALWIHARADLPGRMELPPGRSLAVAQDDFALLRQLWALVAKCAATLLPPPDSVVMNRRQRECCADAIRTLRRDTAGDWLLLAEHLREARMSLAAITGADATEAMLDALFSRFCLGK